MGPFTPRRLPCSIVHVIVPIVIAKLHDPLTPVSARARLIEVVSSFQPLCIRPARRVLEIGITQHGRGGAVAQAATEPGGTSCSFCEPASK